MHRVLAHRHHHRHHASNADRSQQGDEHDHLPPMGVRYLTPLYDLVTRLLGVPSFHRRLVRQAEIPRAGRVLEIGCGTGNLAIRAKRAHPDAQVVGIDPDQDALDLARRKADRGNLEIGWAEGVAEDLGHADGSFDRVLSALMLHHLGPDQQVAALREARRVLTPDGSLHLVDFGGTSDPADGWLARRLARSGRLERSYGDGIPALMDQAGFGTVTEEGHVVRALMGRVTFYRATP